MWVELNKNYDAVKLVAQYCHFMRLNFSEKTEDERELAIGQLAFYVNKQINY